MVELLGAFLKRTRKDLGLTLRQVHELTGISSSYLSQLESGERTRISSGYLGKLAEAYGIPLKEMVMREVASSQDEETQREREREIAKAFEFVIRDPDFEHGEELSGCLSIEAKQFIVEMYEKLIGRNLLVGPTFVGGVSPMKRQPGEQGEGGDNGEEQ